MVCCPCGVSGPTAERRHVGHVGPHKAVARARETEKARVHTQHIVTEYNVLQRSYYGVTYCSATHRGGSPNKQRIQKTMQKYITSTECH